MDNNYYFVEALTLSSKIFLKNFLKKMTVNKRWFVVCFFDPLHYHNERRCKKEMPFKGTHLLESRKRNRTAGLTSYSFFRSKREAMKAVDRIWDIMDLQYEPKYMNSKPSWFCNGGVDSPRPVDMNNKKEVEKIMKSWVLRFTHNPVKLNLKNLKFHRFYLKNTTPHWLFKVK